MTREGALTMMVGIAVLLLVLMAWGWLRRSRRDSALLAPLGDLPEGAPVRAVFHGFYVATTVHDRPLERLAIRGLAFRSKADITVADSGLALDIPGQSRVMIPAERIRDVSAATVAIDRVVEKGGLACLSWQADDATTVDTYLRAQDASSHTVIEAIAAIIPVRIPSGDQA